VFYPILACSAYADAHEHSPRATRSSLTDSSLALATRTRLNLALAMAPGLTRSPSAHSALGQRLALACSKSPSSSPPPLNATFHVYQRACTCCSGDMGVSEYNNMQNLLTDCQSGKIDVFAHSKSNRSLTPP
jgi:hypothetical protein